MPNGTYGGVRGRKTKVGRKPLRFPPTRLNAEVLSDCNICFYNLCALKLVTALLNNPALERGKTRVRTTLYAFLSAASFSS